MTAVLLTDVKLVVGNCISVKISVAGKIAGAAYADSITICKTISLKKSPNNGMIN